MSRCFFPCPRSSCRFPARGPGALLWNSCRGQRTFAFGSKSPAVESLGSLLCQLALEHFLSPKKGRLGGEAAKRVFPASCGASHLKGPTLGARKPQKSFEGTPRCYTCRFKAPRKAKAEQQLLLRRECEATQPIKNENKRIIPN